jgi:hypothetical protein
MKPPRIPPRAPIGDSFKGVLQKLDEAILLAEAPLAGAEMLHEGSLILRYGVVYLGKPHLSIVPALLALDYGAFKTGEEAWDFLLNKSNLFPRADVLGYGNDGADCQVFIKELDLMFPFHILAYSNAEANKPLAQVNAVISGNTETLPPRLLEYAPIYPTIEAWKKASS